MKNMNFKQALAELKKTRKITTGMLKPLNISFESWLRYAQMPEKQANQLINQLIDLLEH
jgi:hypothetical protein